MRSDDEAQYVEYVTAKVEWLRRVAFLLCQDPHRADDLVQKTITKVYVKWRRIAALEHIDSYVRTMLVREFLDEQRLSWARVKFIAEPPEVAAPQSDQEAALLVRSALAALPPKQRAVLVLRFLCDLSVDEVARTLGRSAGTVKSQTSDGLAALRRVLGRDFELTVGGRHA